MNWRGDRMKRFMILGASILQLPAIRKAKEMGLEVVAVDRDEHAVGFACADIPLVISTLDIPRVVDAAKEYRISGAMTLASDMPMRTIAALVKELGIPGIDEQTAIRATNKAEMRRCLKEHSVPIPAFFIARNYEEYLEAVQRLGSAAIVKPADNSGSRGVFLIRDAHDNKQVEMGFLHSKAYSRSGDIVVEEYMSGHEVSVETLSMRGDVHILQITDKLTTGAPHFVEMGHSQPSCLSAESITKVKKVAADAVIAVGIRNGPSHTEIMVTNDGPKIVELGARLGGDCITTHLVPLSTGVDMVECCIRIALGEEADFTPRFAMGSAIRYFPSHAGALTAVEGLDMARAVDGVRQVSIVKYEGDTLSDVSSSTDRIGFVIAQAETVSNAVSICHRAMEKVRIRIGA